MIQYKTKKYGKQYLRRNGDNWVETDVWVKTDTGFHQLVPPNCIILYNTTEHGCVVADGNNGTLNLIGLYPRLGRNELNLNVGSMYHYGAEHGENIIHKMSDYNHVHDAYTGFSFGSQKTYVGYYLHTHDFEGTHIHDDMARNSTFVNGLVPTMYNDVIQKDAVFLSAKVITPEIWFDIIDYGYYLMFTERPSSPGKEEFHYHWHNEVDYWSGEPLYKGSGGYSSNAGTSSASGLMPHKHNFRHITSNANTDPYCQNYASYKTNRKVYFDQLPSGTVVLCVTDYIPKGWSRYTPEDSNIKFCSNNNDYIGKYQGSDTHTHPAKTVESTGVNIGTNEWSNNSNKQYRIAPHTHTYTDEHIGEALNIPPSASLFAIVKD